MGEPEIIDISDLGSNEIGLSGDNLKSTNFGPGIELLMNEKKSRSSPAPGGDDNGNDIMQLEKELNDLTDNLDTTDTIDFSGNSRVEEKPSVGFNLATPQLETVELGEDLMKSSGNDKRMDLPNLMMFLLIQIRTLIHNLSYRKKKPCVKNCLIYVN